MKYILKAHIVQKWGLWREPITQGKGSEPHVKAQLPDMYEAFEVGVTMSITYAAMMQPLAINHGCMSVVSLTPHVQYLKQGL